MSIAKSTLEQLNQRADLVKLIGAHTELKPKGRSFVGCCPFHKEKTPSFYVHPDDGYYYCFGCQESGDAIEFLMSYENFEFLDAVELLASQTGVQVELGAPKEKPSYQIQPQPQSHSRSQTHAQPHNQAPVAPHSGQPDQLAQFHPAQPNNQPHASSQGSPAATGAASSQPVIGDLYELLEAVCCFYQRKLKSNPKALIYLNQRGLSEASIEEFRLGYAPSDWNHLETEFAAHTQGLQKLGLMRDNKGSSYNLLRDRVIFPIRDPRGKVVGFGGRAMSADAKPKYINSPESEVFHKNQILYGAFESKKKPFDSWLLVEGYMDVIALHQASVFGAVAGMGTAVSAESLEKLLRLKPKLVMALDGDQAGQQAAMRALENTLPKLHDNHELKFLTLTDGDDPDSFVKSKGAAAFETKLKNALPLSDFLYAVLQNGLDLTTPEGKTQLLDQAQKLANLLPNHSQYKRLLLSDFKDRLGISYKARNQGASVSDALLNFETGLELKQNLALLLLTQPELLSYAQPLKPLLTATDPLNQLVDLIERSSSATAGLNRKQTLSFLLGAAPAKLRVSLLESLPVFKRMVYQDAFESANTLESSELEAGSASSEQQRSAQLLCLKVTAEALKQLRANAKELSQKKAFSEQIVVLDQQISEFHSKT